MKNVHTLNILQFKKVGVYFLAFMNQSRMLLIASFVVQPHIERAQSEITKRKIHISFEVGINIRLATNQLEPSSI